MSNPSFNQADALAPFLAWFASKGWTPWPFQMQTWQAYFLGKSGLINVPTGAGKTYAAVLGPLAKLAASPKKGLHILYITPLRSLIYDIEKAIRFVIEELKLPVTIQSRTADTSSSTKAKQNTQLPHLLLTTPESLSVLLSDPSAKDKFSTLDCVIVDEWHELIGNKRGVLLQLLLSRLRQWNPLLQTWCISATLNNIEQAATVCLGMMSSPCLIQAKIARPVHMHPLIPKKLEELPWISKSGLSLAPLLIEALSPSQSTLIFTNTRMQAEKWFQKLLEMKPEWESITRLHHSAIDFQERQAIEEGIKTGHYRFVFCTSSLDLGVDFPYVEKVIQIGSTKSVARLVQRAGRASHRPLAPCHLYILPTHHMDLAEIAGLRLALEAEEMESRQPLSLCYDVLIQHLVTCAIGGGFEKNQMWQELRQTYTFAKLSYEDYEWCLQFLTQGGKALSAYPEYRKVIEKEGLYTVEDKKIAARHRLSIGTIPSNLMVQIQFARGQRLGQIEENFLTRLKPKETFLFGGKALELIQLRDGTAYVRLAQQKTFQTPVWQGSSLPFSNILGRYMRQAITSSIEINNGYPESTLLAQLCQLQSRFSALSKPEELLIETFVSKEGFHLFIYPFEGKLVHQGLSALMAYRLSQQIKATYTTSFNDYGFEILSSKPFVVDEKLLRELFNERDVAEDMQASLNLNEMAKTPFRDIAKIAGLIFAGFPSAKKTSRQLQMSTSLLYEVFSQYDSQNLLLKQAKEEALVQSFDWEHFVEALRKINKCSLTLQNLKKISPFALPLYIERISARLSTESLLERIENIKRGWQR